MEEQIGQFEALFTQYSDVIFRHLYFKLGDRERAKELTQEVFMRTWQYLSSGKTIEYEKAFLFRIARNLFINEIRTDKQSSSLDTLTETTGYEPDTAEANPLEFSEEQELLHFLGQLEDNYREVLILRYIDDMAVKDIAQMLEENETTISMRIKRATEKLKTLYHT
ncbi:MAG: RNA polymerase sigma factor [Candidatus Pacebacteria bacterium]|nr:RNA polymerase sigma factor [Candidatus Paceibacterota bacterium]MBP9843092.1 RNA polymerase sigma factor [Candidatus Paceibacterota bacterium]